MTPAEIYAKRLQAIATAITNADPFAPAATGWIGVGQKGCFAWEHPGRLAQATELMRATMRPDGYAMVALYSTKEAVNVGATMRAAQALGAAAVQLFGPQRPRKERNRDLRTGTDTGKAWRHVPLLETEVLIRPKGAKVVAVEIEDGAEALPAFAHPKTALYCFGPEDGCLPDIGADVKLTIPSAYCLNLAMSVGIVLYDRIAKAALKQGAQT